MKLITVVNVSFNERALARVLLVLSTRKPAIIWKVLQWNAFLYMQIEPLNAVDIQKIVM